LHIRNSIVVKYEGMNGIEMTLTLQIPPDIESQLSQLAIVTGRTVEAFVLEALEEKLSTAPGCEEPLSAISRLEEFRDWFASHPSSKAADLDDSRESIYDGRGE
jgi:predicted DNA-binding protein